MTEIELLRELFAFAQERPGAALPPGELRFVLEYEAPPDRAAEVDRLQLLLQTNRFALRPLFEDAHADADLARFLVLAAPGVDRPLLQEQLFALAHTLREQLQVVSVEPDVGSAVYADPEPPSARPRREMADAIGRLCWVESAPPELSWAVDNVRARDAWALSPKKGLGILIGQPDTGVAPHTEIEPGALRLDLGRDTLQGGSDPTDPLDPASANPGHGTGTASVAVGREEGRIAGAAPGASLVPIRCISDVKVFDVAPVAAAINHARVVGCHVITMSLGGVPGRALHAAIAKAIADGVIVLAAAGNCVRIVVWPARYDAMIAVGGSNVLDQPWRGSSRGDDVDISAPAEFVWRAQRQQESDPLDGIGAGQGTSFAVALTAGTAALWLAHHGREAVLAEAEERAVTVQALFRTALRTTARRPSGWDTDDFGAGIINARALLDLDLANIPAVKHESAAPAQDSSILRLAAEMSSMGAEGHADVELPHYGLEIASLLLEDARVGGGPRGQRPEARAKAGASRQLRAELTKAADPRLRALAARRTIPVGRVLRHDAATAVNALSILASRGHEGSAPLSAEAAHAALTPATIRASLDHAESVLTSLARDDDAADVIALRRQVLTGGEEVLRRMADIAPAAPLAPSERLAYEAMVLLHGRPALRVESQLPPPGPPGAPATPYQTVSLDAPEVSEWQAPIEMALEDLKPLLGAVGRIDLDGEHIGTGFVVEPGVVMTNRHVIEAIATAVPRRRNPVRWVLNSGDVTINFSPDAADPTASFRVKAVIFAGPDPIEDVVEFAHLDLALLDVETTNSVAAQLPPACTLSSATARVRKGAELFAVGFPAMPIVPDTDPVGVKRSEVVEQLRKIFGLRFGRKYFSPGRIHLALGQDPTDSKQWVFGHDATTLGGNSGSPVCFFGDGLEVIGLHFAGDWMRANHAHSLLTVKPHVPRMNSFRWR